LPLRFLSPIHRASRQIRLYLEPQTTRIGVSPTEGHLITYLRSYGPCPIGELHRVFGYRRSTLTSICDRLENAQLLKRSLDPEDRRSFLVGLTGRGERLSRKIQTDLEELESKVRQRIAQRDLEGFEKVMAAIAQVTQIELRRKEER
jgi:DNA-binding MarR family transcriptional regulator